MNWIVFIVGLFAVHSIQCRSIFMPIDSFAPYDEQSGQFSQLLKREKKQAMENPSDFDQDAAATFNFHPLSAAPVVQAPNVFVPGPILQASSPPLTHQQNDFDRFHQHEQRPFHEQNTVIPSLFPELTKPNDVMKKLRSMLDRSPSIGEKLSPNEPQSQFRSYQSGYPVQYHASTEQRYGPAYPPYPPQAPVYEKPIIPIAPSYEPQYAPPSSCGSNLLIGCRPQVQTVPCFSPPSYNAPYAYNNGYESPRPLPPPPPPPSSYYKRPAYAPSYNAPINYRPQNSPKYNSPPIRPSAHDVYSQPGPPYPEPNLSSINEPNEPRMREESPTTSTIRQDSEPEPSNIAKKTEGCQTNQETVTSAIRTDSMPEAATPPINAATTHNPSTEDQVRRLHDKLDTHVENLKRYKEHAGEKLRLAIERANVHSSVDDLDEMNSVFDEPLQYAKRHTNRERDYIYNSVW